MVDWKYGISVSMLKMLTKDCPIHFFIIASVCFKSSAFT